MHSNHYPFRVIAGNSWYQTFTGRAIDPLNLEPEDICIEDIAHSLANTCRFNGHCREFYSVAQHCVEGVVRAGLKGRRALQFLLHDASEAYLVDMPRPVKNGTDLGAAYKEVEAKLDHLIYDKWDVVPTKYEHDKIKELDNKMLVTEKRDLVNHLGLDWGWDRDIEPFTRIVIPRDSACAKKAFVRFFKEHSPR